MDHSPSNAVIDQPRFELTDMFVRLNPDQDMGSTRGRRPLVAQVYAVRLNCVG
jgi:hypothetical protein